MFTNAALNTSNRLQQEDHGSVATRPVPVQFPFGSRSLLVRSSFVSRSSLVRLSLVYRGPIEDRTRNKQKTNERATNVDRDADEKLSATRRFATVMAGRTPFCNPKTAYCPSPYFCRGRKQHFQPHLGILMANQAFSTHSAHSTPQQKPLKGSKNISPPYCPTTIKDTSYPS